MSRLLTHELLPSFYCATAKSDSCSHYFVRMHIEPADRNSNGLTSILNKTVLLCERKRHTARCVSSTPSSVLSQGGTPSLDRGYPVPGWGYPVLGWGGTPSLDRGYPIHGQGTPCPDLTGVPPPRRPDLAEVPPTPGCEQTENITFPILRMRAVMI